MIEIESVRDQYRQTGQNPYLTPIDEQSNPDNYGTPYDDMICELREMKTLLSRMANSAEQARVRPKLGMFPFVSTGPTTGATSTVSTTVRFRVQELVITTTGASVVTLNVGASAQMTFVFATGDTKRYSYPVLFDRGVDVSLTATGGVGVSGYFTAYPDD